MTATEPKQLLTELMGCYNRGDWDGVAARLADDYVEDWPQTGERVRGVANMRRVFEGYPGGGLERGLVDEQSAAIVGSEERYVVSPSMTLIRVDGGGEFYTVTYTTRYPDGSRWYVLTVARVTDGKVRSGHTYFAPILPAPEWRQGMVERIDGAS
jgi:SnoaL-like domain